MARDFLKGIRDSYDVVVIGSGLGGLTGANYLAKLGHSVLLLEHHYQYGGLAWPSISCTERKSAP